MAGTGIAIATRPQYAGRAPFALQTGASLGDTYGALFALPVSGGAVLVPIVVPAPMLAGGIDLLCMDAADLHEAEWRLYRDVGTSTLAAVPGMSGTFSFTPVGESIRASAAAAVARLFPGLYWLAVRNTSDLVEFNIGQIGLSSFYRSVAQTQTLAAALADTLDGSAGWSKVERLYAVALAGQVMGEASSY